MTSPTRPPHHTDRGFRNPAGSPVRAGHAGRLGFLWRMLTRGRLREPLPDGHALAPEQVRDGLARHAAGESVTWLGHAAFLLRLGGKTVLLDPYLGAYASPLRGLGPKRFVPAPLGPADLPPIDALVVSHNHYDHLCAATVEALPGKDRIAVLVPLGLGGFFRSRGFARVHELDWHEAVQLDGLRVTALPAIHWSRRTAFDRNRSLWASFAIASAERRVWFAGDTGYGPVFADIGRDYGPFDLALVGIGAYEPRSIMAAHHTTPEEAVRLGQDLRAATLAGMHWGTVILTEEPPFEAPARFRSAAAAAGYHPDRAWIMRIGETRALPGGWPENG